MGDDLWRILTVEGNRALLLSDQILALSAYHSRYEQVNWDSCDLNPHLQTAMKSRWGSDLCAHVEAKSPRRSTTIGTSADGFFLLSEKEAQKYGQAKVCTKVDDGKPRWWWLRSVGGLRGSVPVVGADGTLSPDGIYVRVAGSGVRPALWMNLES